MELFRKNLQINVFQFRKAILFGLMIFITACTPKALQLTSETLLSIDGKIQVAPSALSMDASATCTGTTASIYKMDSSGQKSGAALDSTSVNPETGAYKFKDVIGNVMNLSGSDVKYLIEVVSCNGKIFQRLITGKKSQDISFATDLLTQALALSVFKGKSVESYKRDDILSFGSRLDSLGATDTQNLYTLLVADLTLSNDFLLLFGFPASELVDALPKINLPVIFNLQNEAITLNSSVVASHWDPAYSTVYEWRWDNGVISTSTAISKAIGKNDQGSRILVLKIGKNDGGGNIDATKPSMTKTWNLNVSNDYLPTPPAISVGAAITTVTGINVDLDTGVAMVNCETFSSLALTENNIIMPLPGAFNITCSSGTTQAVPFTLNATNGLKTLRLWARDSAGNISVFPQTLMVTLDNENPTVSLTSFNSGQYKGGSVAAITWSASDTGSGVAANGIHLEYSADNGSSWNTIATSQANSGSYNWTLPSINSTTVLVRVTAADMASHTGSATSSSAFTIDNTAPSLSLTSLNAGAYQGGSTQSITWTSSDAGVGLTATPISLDYSTDNGSTWTSIATGLTNTGTYSWALPSIDSNTVRVRVSSVDAVGNLATASSTSAVFIDITAPTLSLTNFDTGAYEGAVSKNILWSAADSGSGLGATSIAISYSTDSGATWTAITAGTANDGSESWNVPALEITTARIRITATDAAGHSTTVISSSDLTIDSTDPTISSFDLAGGLSSVALPGVTVQITASDNLSGLHEMRLSETAAYADDNWQPFHATDGGYSLSMISGAKTVYIWVRDAAGNVSASSSKAISLDLGNPPTVSITAPVAGAGPYVPTDSINIAWSCSSINPLDANPARVRYTKDDGLTFDDITTWIPNNLSATTGDYNWTFPAGVDTFRILVECKSAAGVVASAYSGVFNSPGWSIFVGDPSNMRENVNASVALMTSGANAIPTMAVDPKGHIYISKKPTIIKVDASTGLVTRYAGDPQDDVTCNLQEGSDPLNSAFNKMGSVIHIFGMNAARDSMIFTACSKTWSMNTTTRALTLIRNSAVSQYAFFTRSGYIYYYSAGRIRKLNLNIPFQTPVDVAGNGTCAATISAAGTEALSSPVVGTSAGACAMEYGVILNPDETKLWMVCWNSSPGCGAAARLDWDANLGKYIVGSNALGWGGNDGRYQKCVPSYKTPRVWCSNRSEATVQTYFNTQTATWTSSGISATYIRYAPSPIGMISFATNNLLKAYVENADNSITSGQIGGMNINSFGNGSNLSKVAFYQVEDVAYTSAMDRLFIDTSTNLRQINFGTGVINSLSISSDYYNALTINRAGTRLTTVYMCSGSKYLADNFNGTTLSAGTAVMSRNACGAATYDATYPVAQDTPVSSRVNWTIDNLRRPLHHSNGRFYFFQRNGNSHALIYSSSGGLLKIVAGMTGTRGYDAGHHGLSATLATLSDVRSIWEIPAGKPNVGDLLVLDANHLRMITIATEPGDPKIYDVVDLGLATSFDFANGSATFKDAVYDFDSEVLNASLNPVPGTGAFYYVNNLNAVRKFKVTTLDGSGVPNAATDDAYDFTGTTLEGTVRLALTPSGLMVTQPNKERVLRVSP